MFNFLQWRAFLEAKAKTLKSEGMQSQFSAGREDAQKPAMILEIIQNDVCGAFENWATGETDYTVMSAASQGNGLLAHKWCLKVTDETFETTFDEFLIAFRRFTNPENSN